MTPPFPSQLRAASFRSLLAVLALSLLGPLSAAQAQSDTDTTAAEAVGRLVYFEGTVRVQADGDWAPGRIDQSLRPDDSLATGPDATAEIEWTDGRQSTLGPADTQRVGRLHARAQTKAPEKAAGLLDRFRDLFTKETEETGGPAAIRRGADPFEQAAALYRRNQCREARPLFEKVLASESAKEDGPAVDSTNAALGHLALADCFLQSGEKEQARSALEAITERHPETRAAAIARELLGTL